MRAYAAVPGRVAAEELDEVVRVLAARANRTDVPVGEVGAVVECLSALGADSAVDQVLDRYPKLSEADVRRWFAEVHGRSGEPLWCRAPATGTALEFEMGSPLGDEQHRDDEGPVRVVLGKPFWIAATTITLGQYRLFQDEHRHTRGEDARVAVTGVTWFEASLFARWLDRQRRRDPGGWKSVVPADADGWRFQLPTEAQWEFAARAGTSSRYWSGDEEQDLARVGWYSGNSGTRVHAVAEIDHGRNAWGLYDVHGNVWEWCHDWYAGQLSGGLDPTGASRAGRRVLRGGSYGFEARFCRSADRLRLDPGRTDGDNGFRVALAAPRLGIEVR